MTEATPKQVAKIIDSLTGIPSERIATLIDSGRLHEVFQKGGLDQLLTTTKWDMLRMLTDDYRGISITIPRYPAPVGRSDDSKRPYQLRCWKGAHGNTDQPGHIDSHNAGLVVMELYIADRLHTETWVEQLNQLGFSVSAERWVLEPKMGYDIVTRRCSGD